MKRAAVALSAVALLTACTVSQPAPEPPAPATTTATPEGPRDFTIATTDPATSFDPAAAKTAADDVVAYNVFQRLMTTSPGDATLRPDAASDCLFDSPVIYRCTLRDGLKFSNGDVVTSNDVKFSVLRAFRLGASTSAQALASLDHIETPADNRVEFHLKWTDNQFGYALTSPAASIVDSKLYSADKVRPTNMSVVGSGPYMLSSSATNLLLFESNQRYKGFSQPGLDRIIVSYFKDVPSMEDAATKGQIDVIWRGLSQAAVQRLTDQSRATNAPANAMHPVVQPGAVFSQLAWNPSSSLRGDATLRTVVATALQGDRTADSLLPASFGDLHTASFPLGGKASIPALPGARQRLTMTYVGTNIQDADLASRVRDRLEQAGISVQLTPDEQNADLRLTDTTGWVYAPVAYLLPYLASPLPGSAQKLGELDQRYRGVNDKAQQAVALSEIQKQAAADLLVLPIEQHDGVIFTGPGVSMNEPRFGPNWQFALWSYRK